MRAIVNLVTDTPGYRMGQNRLHESLKGRFDGHFFGFVGEDSVGAPLHSDNPYAFKLYAIKYLMIRGYTTILWLDASIYAVADVNPLFNLIEEQGTFFESSGWMTGAWANEDSLRLTGLSREEAMAIPMISGGFVGFNFCDDSAVEFFSAWWQMMEQGVFKGSWDNHRHDQTAASIIAHRMNRIIYDPGTYFSYVGPGYADPKPTALFHLQGI